MSPPATGNFSKGLTQLPPTPVPTTSASTVQPTAPPSTSVRASHPPPPPPPPPPFPQDSIQTHRHSIESAVMHVAPRPLSPRRLPIFLVGISGAPLCGQTTLSDLLNQIFPPETISFIYDEDDYVQLNKSSVTPAAGSYDADESAQLVRALKELKENGKLPSTSKTLRMSQSGARTIEYLVTPEVAQKLRKEIAEKLELVLGNRKIGIVEGLLPLDNPLLRDLLDVKLLLPVSKAAVKQNCLAKFDHLPSMGEDYRQASEYFENVAWSKYARAHRDLFRHGDVEGSVKKHVCRELEIDIQPRLGSMEDTLKWAVGFIIRRLKVKNEKSNQADIRNTNDQYDLCHCRDGVLGRVRQFLFDLL